MTDRDKAIAAIARVVRAQRWDYQQFNDICRDVRKALELKRVRKGKRLPKILTEDQLKALYEIIDKAGNLKHQIMLRFLLYTGVRVSELANLLVEDVDFRECKVFLRSGKGDKDRYILFPESFKLALQAHIAANPNGLYLFEGERKQCFRKPLSPRRIQEIVKEYAQAAGVDCHPHLFRHQLLTWLTEQGMTDAQIQLISGHSSKRSLEVYQHVGLESAKPGYRDAMKKLEI